MLAPSVMLKYVVDDYILPGQMSGVWLIAGAFMLILILTYIIESYTFYEIQKIGQESIRDLRMDLFRHLEHQSLGFFDKKAVGWLVTRMTSDVNVLHELFAQGVVGIFQQMFTLVGILAVLLYFNVYLTLWTMIIVPLVMLLSWFFRRRIRVSYRLTRLRLSRLNTHVQENVTGMRTVQANTQEERQHRRFLELNDLYRDAHYQTVFAFSIFFPMIEIISVIAMSLIIWQGGGQFMKGAITVGELIMFFTLLDRFFMPIRDLSEKYNLVQAAIAAAERLFKLLDTKPAIQDPEQPKEWPGFRHSIEFRDVWFAYKDEDWVLRGVSFKIERGQNVAIVGPTGSGKTTLMSLLCRFYDIQKGQILIDGVDLREMKQDDFRRHIAIVLQDVFLFNGSVEQNIRLGEKSIDDERIREVAKAVGAHPFIERLPRGYETGVMERGATLSVGQKQLLSFARALAFDPDILILDEATSSIDTETEQLIQEAVGRISSGRTALIIAHRLSTIQRADKILVIHHGHLAEEGNHQELLARDGLYRRLYELQYREELAG
ncbi:ABC transporter ATP-binding protein/permease [bacterium]|nr:ABC transporter ATP-binding protein/permease [bacterium]